MDLRIALKKFSDSFQMIWLSRRFQGDQTHNGFVIGVGNELVLLLQFHDFSPNGFTAIRIADVEKIQRKSREEFFEDVIKSDQITTDEQLLQFRNQEFTHHLGNFRQLAQHFYNKNINIIIECENIIDFNVNLFYI